jgi:subtilisin family serine protease
MTGVQAIHDNLKNVSGKGIKVGIIDSGVDYLHPALGGCFGPGCKVRYGYDFADEDEDPRDWYHLHTYY